MDKLFTAGAYRKGMDSVATEYEEPRAHALRERYLGLFGGPELPVPV